VTENDANALPVAGALVSVQVTAGTVSPTSGITDENGLITLQITAGATIGAVEITANTSINNETFTGVLNYQVVEYVPYLLQLTLLGPDAQPTSSLAKDTQGTLEAKVISADGSATPVANILVNTSTSIGSLVPSNGQALTNSSGIASFTVVAGSNVGAGAFTSTAQIGDLTINNELNFQVTDETQTVSYFLELTLLDSDGQPTNSLAKTKQGTLQAKVTSGSLGGTPVPGVIVSGSTDIGTLAPSNGRSLTDSNGIATFTISAGSVVGAGTLSTILQIGDVTLNRALNFQVADGVIGVIPYFVDLILLGPDGQPTTSLAKNTRGTLQARLTSGSENGSAVPNELVSAIATIGNLLPDGQALSNGSGFANFTIEAGSTIAAGSATATIQIGGNTYSDTLNYEVVENIPYSLELTLLGPDGQPTTALAKNTQGTLLARVTSTDGSNTPAAGVLVSASSTIGSLVPGNGQSLSNSNGVATFTVVAGSNIAAGAVTANVQIDGETFSATKNFEVVDSIPYVLELTLLGPDGQPTTALAKNTQGTLQARVTSTDGSSTPADGVLVSANSTFGNLVPGNGQSLTNASGIAIFSVVAGADTGAGVLSGSVEIGSNTFNDSLNFEVIEGDLYFVQLTLLGSDGQPTNQLTEDTQGTLQARITSEAGDPIANVIVNATTTFGSLVPGNGQSLTDANGIATFRVEAGAASGAGVLTGTVQIGGNTFTNTLNFKVVGDELYFVTLTLLDSDNQATTAITERTEGSLQILVTRDSESGPPVAGVIVTVAAQLGTLEPNNGLTNSVGIVTLKYLPGTVVGAGAFSASTVIAGDTFNGNLNFEITQRVRKLGYFIGSDFIENQIRVIPGTGSTLSAGADARLSVVILDENDERVTEQEQVIFTSDCVAAGQSVVSPANPTSVFAEATTTYTTIICSGIDNITASIAGTDAQAFGTLDVAPPETTAIHFISAEPEVIALRGTGGRDRGETSNLVFQVIDQSGRPLPGVRVDLTLTPEGTDVGGLSLSNDYGISNADGNVTVTVHAGDVATPVVVLASVGEGIDKVDAPSSVLIVTTGLPEQNTISLSTERFVIPNAANVNNVTNTLTVNMDDRFHKKVPGGTAAVFWTEYGSTEPGCTTGDLASATAGTCTVVWSSTAPKAPKIFPESVNTINNTDCPAFDGSEDYVPCPDDLGFTRGMRSNVIVFAIGEETFIDRNGNGIMDEEEKELFVNLGEAFTDHNEDGVYTPDLPECIDKLPDDPTLSAQCKAGYDEEFVDYNNNGEYDPQGSSPMYNGLRCPIEGDGVWCSRTLLNVWDSLVITLSEDTTWASVMVRDSIVVGKTVTGLLQTIYISDQYNNPPPAGSTVTLAADGNCEIVGPTTYTVPSSQAQGAFPLSVRTKRSDSPPTNPEYGTFSVTLNPIAGAVKRWDYDCDTPDPVIP
jgi:hypothetical protein